LVKGSKNGQWTQRHEAERLMQLKLDLDSSLGRWATQCYRKSIEVGPEQADEWLRRMERIEELRTWAQEDLARFIKECCDG
jgi:hypothetical protein